MRLRDALYRHAAQYPDDTYCDRHGRFWTALEAAEWLEKCFPCWNPFIRRGFDNLTFEYPDGEIILHRIAREVDQCTYQRS